MKRALFLLFIFFFNTNYVLSYEPWNCISNSKCVTSTDGLNVEFKGKIKNNLPYKGKISIPGINAESEGTFKILGNNSPILIKGFFFDGETKFYKKKGKWYKYEGGGYSFKGEFYDKPTKPKKGKLTQPNGNIFEGTFYDRNKNNFKTGTYTIKNEGKVKYVNGKIVSRSGFKKKSSRSGFGINFGFLTPILALVSIYAGVLIVGHPFMPLWRSASDPFTKILLIIGVIIAYLVVISILFALIGFGWDNFDTPPEGLRPRFFGDSR